MRFRMKRSIVAVSMSGIALSGSIAVANADEGSRNEARFSPGPNGNQVKIAVTPDIQFSLNDSGTVNIESKDTGKNDALPAHIQRDKGTGEVILEYKIVNPQTIMVTGYKDGVIYKGWWDSWGRCVAGTAGGAGGGALAGGAAGSVIPALGATAGGVIGGVSGGLTGAAAAC